MITEINSSISLLYLFYQIRACDPEDFPTVLCLIVKNFHKTLSLRKTSRGLRSNMDNIVEDKNLIRESVQLCTRCMLYASIF
jgi:hypothetical protein